MTLHARRVMATRCVVRVHSLAERDAAVSTPPLNAAPTIIIVAQLTLWGDLYVSAAHRCRDDDSSGVGDSRQRCLWCGSTHPKAANRRGHGASLGSSSAFHSFGARYRRRATLRRLRAGTRARSSNEPMSWTGGRRSLSITAAPRSAQADWNGCQHSGRAPLCERHLGQRQFRAEFCLRNWLLCPPAARTACRAG
jgi:hypothetical protein